MTTAILNPKNGESLETSLTDAQALDVLRHKVGGDFARSLCEQFDRRGLSACQWFHVQRMANEYLAKQKQQAASGASGNGSHGGPPPGSQSRDIVLSRGSFARIDAIFASAYAAGLKHPKIRFEMQSEDGGEPIDIMLSIAGQSAKVPGSINVASHGSFDNRTWYGRIVPRDLFQPSRDNRDEVTDVVRKFCEDPATYAALYGRKVGRCCFCGLELTDKRSLFQGYGPVCAENWGLPWGQLPPTESEGDDATT